MQIVIYNYLKIFFLVLFLLTGIPFSRNIGIPKGGRIIALDERIPVAVGFVELVILGHLLKNAMEKPRLTHLGWSVAN